MLTPYKPWPGLGRWAVSPQVVTSLNPLADGYWVVSVNGTVTEFGTPVPRCRQLSSPRRSSGAAQPDVGAAPPE
jgi:hypothetical protein